MAKIANTSLSAAAMQPSGVLLGWMCDARTSGFGSPIADQEMLFRSVMCGEDATAAPERRVVAYFHPALGEWCELPRPREVFDLAQRLADGYRVPISVRIGRVMLSCYPVGGEV